MKAQLQAWWRSRFGPLTLGEQGERLAARHLRRQGYKIVALRRRLRYGEFDIIAVDGERIVFVEVKTRRGEQLARPAIAVNAERRQRMTRAALAYMKSHDLLDYQARFDIVEVLWPERRGRPHVTHHQAAFRAEGRGQFFR